MLDFVKQVLFGQYPIKEQFAELSNPQLQFLAIDLELTDLNSELAKVTSIGWVTGSGYQVNLKDAEYSVVRTKGDLKQSPIIHRLTAKEIAQGCHIREQMTCLQQFVDTHVWVFHHATLDIPVLQKLWQSLELPAASVTTIDTMMLEIYMCEKVLGFVPGGAVTLNNARKRYGLVQVPLHNALDDALASLTLLYAQLYALDKKGQLNLPELSFTRAIKTFTLGHA